MDRLRPLPPLPQINIANFQNAGEGFLVISPEGSVQAVSDLSLAGRVQVSAQPGYPFDSPMNQRAWKQAFFDAVVRTGGEEIAREAFIQAGLINYVNNDGIPLHSRDVKKITHAAKECWERRRIANEKAEAKHHATQPMTACQNAKPPKPAKQAPPPPAINREKSRDTKTVASPGPVTKFQRVFPHLASFDSLGNCSGIEEVEQFLQQVWQQGPCSSLVMPLLYHADRKYLTAVIAIIKAIKDIQGLFSQMGITPEEWNGVIQGLDVKINILAVYLKLLAAYSPTTTKETSFHQCLLDELSHQLDLLNKKKACIELIRDRDPFSEQRVAHSNFIWAKVAALLFDEAEKYCLNTAHDKFKKLRQEFENFVEKEKAIALNKSNTRVAIPKAIPSALMAQDDHPVNRGKQFCLELLAVNLKKIGLRDEDIKAQFTKEKVLLDALRRVVNSEKPPTDTQIIVASLNGVTDWFTIETEYVEGWVSSAETKAYGIPRNCKIHRLTDSQGRFLFITVAHGVIDMWGIKDKEERAASSRESAYQVMSLAAKNNPRVLEKCKKGIVPTITHVSNLLVTPIGITQAPGIKSKTKNYHEKDYKKAQLAAFKSVQDQGFVVVNGCKVNVNIITFSFGINILATGEHNGKITGGWKNVKKHNYHSMERFIGKLGEFHVPGQRPGGFIGHVMDLIAASNLPPAAKKAHLSRLQQHTDIVRELFLSKSYKQSGGDPAKMPREIAVLNAYAEKALSAIDSDEAATDSVGCKSCKDRGAVVASEVMHELIIEDLGGSIVPNQQLNDEEIASYLGVAAMQFPNQIASTALPGYKATGRDIGKDGQTFLTGLSPLAKE